MQAITLLYIKETQNLREGSILNSEQHPVMEVQLHKAAQEKETEALSLQSGSLAASQLLNTKC